MKGVVVIPNVGSACAAIQRMDDFIMVVEPPPRGRSQLPRLRRAHRYPNEFNHLGPKPDIWLTGGSYCS